MYNKKDLEYVCTLDSSMIHKNDVLDAPTINIDTTLPIQQRLLTFLDEINNPYCFFIGNSVVEIEYSDSGNTLQTLLKNHFMEHRNHSVE